MAPAGPPTASAVLACLVVSTFFFPGRMAISAASSSSQSSSCSLGEKLCSARPRAATRSCLREHSHQAVSRGVIWLQHRQRFLLVFEREPWAQRWATCPQRRYGYARPSHYSSASSPRVETDPERRQAPRALSTTSGSPSTPTGR